MRRGPGAARPDSVASFGSFEWEPDVRRLTWSDDAFEILGVPRGVTPSSAVFRACLHPDDHDRVVAELDDFEASSLGYVLRYRIVRSDGEVRHIHEQGARMLGPPKGRRVVVGTLLDVTADVEAAERLAVSQERLRHTLDSQIDPFEILEAVRDADGRLVDLRYLEANEASLPLHGRTRQELIGATMLELYPDLAGSAPLAAYFHTVETGEPLVLDGVPYDSPRLDGVRRYDLRGLRTGDGLAATWRDVTDRWEAALDLVSSEERFRMLAEHASDFVIRSTPMSIIDWVSPSVRQVLGYLPEELVGHRMLEFCHPDDLDTARAASARVNQGERVVERFRIRRADGSYRWLSPTVNAVFDAEGAVVARVGSWRDIQREVEADTARQASEAQYRLLAENAADVVFRGSRDNVLEWVSPSVTELLGFAPAEMVGHPVMDFFHPDDLPRLLEAAHQVDSGETARYEARLRTRADDYRWVGISVRPYLDEDGIVRGRVGTWRDVGDEVRARSRLEQSERLFRTAMGAAAIGMAITDLDGSIRVVNGALCELLRRDEAWLLEHAVLDVLDPATAPDVSRAAAELVRGDADSVVEQVRLVRADGALLWVRAAVVLMRLAGDDADYFMIQVEDMTAEHEAREQLAYQAFHDSLTGLRNRAWILDILSVDLRQSQRDGSTLAVLFVDLDNFKVVNDSLGHAAGDEVLSAVGDRIAGALRPGDRVGRFGGDEFVLVLPQAATAADVERVAERVSAAVARDLMVYGHRIIPSVSIGIAMSTPSSTPESLLRDTDAALFRAKQHGRAQWQFFDDAMHAQAVSRLTVEDALRNAVTRDELVVHFQPMVTLADRRVCGHEALVRWQHPERGLLAPADFLDVAEDSGLIVEVGAAVLDKVCALLAHRPDLPGPVSVNVSAVQLAHGDWFARFASCVDRHGVDPSRLVVEVTETAVLSVLDSTREQLVALRALGSGLHLDDFGTGYSSISVLQELPVTGIKLDRRFVRDLGVGESPAEVLAAGLAGLARGLHLMGVAEGIETIDQAHVLMRLGWTHGQGFLFGRPQPEPVTAV
jgi:diguanylate cyclase (GGDEF)-like protein/PAS domain S-box-containing protein